MKRRLMQALLGIVVVAHPLGFGAGAPVAKAQGGLLTGVGLQAQYFDTKNFNDLKVGDHIEAFEVVEVKRTLEG